MIYFRLLIISLILPLSFDTATSQCFSCKNLPPGVIWCDDFEDGIPLSQKYFEYSNSNGFFSVMPLLGRDSTNGVRVRWKKGEVSAGSIKKSFGKTPGTYFKKNSVNPDSTYDEIYWRIDVKEQEGWTGGGPAKLTRALCMANENWATGLMAHLWSGGTNDSNLVMDPASGISPEGNLVSTKYNDFENLRWLGNKKSKFALYAAENVGQWHCIEGHAKLNTPGKSDGIFEFWINDSLQNGSYNLNWHGTWNNDLNNYKINAIFFENYWNDGSPVEQERYFDNIVISTKRISCKCAEISDVNENRQSEAGFKIQQPPGNDILIFETQINSYTNPRLVISDIFGRELVKYSNFTSEKIYIDISIMPAGMYFISFSGDFMKTATKKFVILK